MTQSFQLLVDQGPAMTKPFLLVVPWWLNSSNQLALASQWFSLDDPDSDSDGLCNTPLPPPSHYLCVRGISSVEHESASGVYPARLLICLECETQAATRTHTPTRAKIICLCGISSTSWPMATKVISNRSVVIHKNKCFQGVVWPPTLHFPYLDQAFKLITILGFRPPVQ